MGQLLCYFIFMKIGVLGTGMVGRAHAAKLTEKGHDVLIGTNDVKKTMSETKPDNMGNPPYAVWQKDHSKVKLATFSDTAKHGEVVINALNGQASLKVLNSIKNELKNKILIDISNPLDFSKGMPPSLFISNTDSLGEQIQKALPDTKVVKSLNTVNAYLQVDPMLLANGEHHIFISGNDPEAKKQAAQYIKDWYGWKNILDLGDITTSRGPEMYLPLWLRMWSALQNPMFNIHIQTGPKP